MLLGGQALPAADGVFQGFFAHNGAVHLFLGQAAEVIGDFLIGHLGGLFHGLALDELGKGRAGSNGAGTAEGLELGIFDDAFRGHLEHELESVAAGKAAGFTYDIGIFENTGVAGVQEVIAYSISIFPHNCLLNSEWAFARDSRSVILFQQE